MTQRTIATGKLVATGVLALAAVIQPTPARSARLAPSREEPSVATRAFTPATPASQLAVADANDTDDTGDEGGDDSGGDES